MTSVDISREDMTEQILEEATGPLCGIYKITHKVLGKTYIGQSIDICKRWSDHRCSKADYYIARAIRKHGPDAFTFEIVELCKRKELNDREAFYIEGFDCLSPKGYNMRSGGGQASVFCEETRAKMRASSRRLAKDPEWLEKNRERLRRLHADPEWLEKRAEASRRKAQDPEYREKNRKALQRLHADPKVQENHRKAMQRRSQDTEWQENHRKFLQRLHADPVWQENNRKAMQRLAQNPVWQENNRKVMQRWSQDPEWRENHRKAMQRRSQDTEWLEKITEANRRTAQDPVWQAKRLAATREALADHQIHTLFCIKSGKLERGKRFELREKLGLDESCLRDLIKGKLKTCKGWCLEKNIDAVRDNITHRTHVLVHIESGKLERGKRFELRSRLGFHSSSLSALIKGKLKTSKGWRLATPEEIKNG